MTPESQIKQYTIPEFAERIRKKFPQYKDLGDNDLTDRILKKHPEYKSRINFGTLEQAEASVNKARTRLDAARKAYTSAGGQLLNPPVTERPDYFRPLTTTERAAQKRGEPVVISSTQPQMAPAAPETASRPRKVGILEQGNVDLTKRPRVKNRDGTVSTVRSISVNMDGREVLLPTVSDDGRILTEQQAIDQYRKTGKHLGVFDSPISATAYAKKLHEDQARAINQPPVSLAPVVQGRLEAIQKQNRQKEIQQKVQQARQIRERAQGLLLPKGQRNQGAAYQPKFGLGQTYREVPKLDKTVPNVTEMLTGAVTEKPLTFEQDRAVRAQTRREMERLEGRAGAASDFAGEEYKNFLRLNRTFDSPKMREDFLTLKAKERIAEHGSIAGAILAEDEETARRQRVAQMGNLEYAAQLRKGPILGVASGAGTALKGLAVASRKIIDQITDTKGFDTQDAYVYQLGEAIEKNSRALLRSNPDLEKEFFVGKAPEALGQSALFLLGGWVTKSPKLAISILGGTMTAGDAYEEVRTLGGSDEEAVNAGLLAGAILGPTELIGTRFLRNALEGKVQAEALKAALKTALITGSKEGLENSIQEIGQEAGQGLITGNPRSLAELAEAGALGGIAGVVGTGTTTLGAAGVDALRNRGQNIVSDYLAASPLSTPEERASAEKSSTQPSVEATGITPESVPKEVVSSRPETQKRAASEDTANFGELNEGGEYRNWHSEAIDVALDQSKDGSKRGVARWLQRQYGGTLPGWIQRLDLYASNAPTTEQKVPISPGIQENITETITTPEQAPVLDQKPEARAETPSISEPSVEKPQQIQPDQISEAPRTLGERIAQVRSRDRTATESQLPQVKEAKDVTQEAVRKGGKPLLVAGVDKVGRYMEGRVVEWLPDGTALVESSTAMGYEPERGRGLRPISRLTITDHPDLLAAGRQALRDAQRRDGTEAYEKWRKRLDKHYTVYPELEPYMPELWEKVTGTRPVGKYGRETPKEVTDEVGAEAAKSALPAVRTEEIKPIWDMSPTELEAARRQEQRAELNVLVAELGEEQGRRFEELNQRRFSRNVSAARARRMEAEIEQILSRATPEARQRIDDWYLASEKRPSSDDYLQHLRNLEDIGGASNSEETMANLLARIIPQIGRETDPKRMTQTQQSAYAQLKYAAQVAREAGLDPRKLEQLTMRAAGNLYGPNTQFMLREFLDLKQQTDTSIPTSKEAKSKPADAVQKLQEWGSRLKTIAQSKDLNALQVLSDEMAAHKDDPRVARLRTAIQDELARAKESEPQLAREESPQIEQAFADWRDRRAYIDGNGNYHIKREGEASGPIAPWNKAVKAAFKNVSEFHQAAQQKPDSLSARGATAGTDTPISVEGNRVSLNLQGAEILTELYKEASQAGQTKGRLRGTFERKGEALARNLDTLAARGREGAKELADAVRQAAKAGNGKAVLFYGESAKKHELFHEASDKANRLMDERHADLPGLINTDTFRTMSDRLIAMGYPGSNLPLLVEEAAAHIAEGRYDQLGITREQAVEWMYKWFQSFEKANPNVNPREFQEMSDEATQARDEVYRTESALREPRANKALPGVQERREGGDRESIAAAREVGGIGRAPTRDEIVRILKDHPLIRLTEKVKRAFLIGSQTLQTGLPTHGLSDVDILLEVPERQGMTAQELTEQYRKRLQAYFVKHNIRGMKDDVHPQWEGKRVDVYFTYDAEAETRPKVELGGESTPLAREPRDVTQTEAFKQWFGDSKVVDEDGKPLVVYHFTTREAEQSILETGFDPSPSRARARQSDEGVPDGIFFTPQGESVFSDQMDFARLAVYLKMESPLRVETREDLMNWASERNPEYKKLRDVLAKYTPPVYKDLYERMHSDDEATKRDAMLEMANLVADATAARALMTETLKRESHDGVIMARDTGGPQVVTTMIVLKPTQIKSATGNRGTFDPNDPNILMARSGDPWTNLTELSDEFGRLANEPELAPGEKPLSLPKTLEDAGLEAGPARGYLPESIVDDGLERAKQVISEKGIDGAIEFVKTGDGIEWASTGYEVSARLREEESKLRAEGKAEEADKTRDKRLTFLDDFASAAVERGRSIVGIKAISEFAPDRMAYALAKASRKKRKRGLTPEEESKITKLGEELGLLEERNKELEKRLAEATSRAKQRTGTKAKPKKTDYQSKLEQQASTVLQTLKPKLGRLDFSGFEKKGQSGAAGVPTLMPPLPGDAELIAQYAAAQLAKFNTVAELNQHLVQEFGQDIEQHLPKIRQRAYAIRQEARLAEIEASETEPKRRKTILSEIQKEIAESLTTIREAQKAQDRALKAEKSAQVKSERAEARLEARQARESEHEARKQEIKEARARLKQQRQEYKQASQAETKGYRETIKAQREAERKAELWDTPLRNAAAEARTRLKDATDPKDPQTADDLIAVAAEKFLPTETGGNPRTGAVDPSRVYKDLKDEFPNLVTKKNQGDLYKKGYQRIQDATAAAREAARLRSASAEAKRLWDELGIDVDAQGVLIQQAEVRRQTDELRRKAQAEFQRVSRTMLEKLWMEAQAIPRSLQSSIDAPIGRQGAYFLLTHPLETVKTAVPATLKGYGSIHVSDYIAREKELAQHPDYKLAVNSGLELTQTSGEGDPALVAEEQHQSALASRLFPHVRLSEQGYVLGMNAQRLAMFSRLADVGRADGYTPETNPEFFEAVAQFVNDGTGRGTLPDALKRASALLNFFFFSTRLNVSRIQLLNDLFNPLPYIPERFNPARAVPGIGSYDPAMRKVMGKELLRLGLSISTVLLLSAAMGIKVEFDPDDPDGLLLRIRNTRYDITGGEAGTIKFLYRLMKSIYRTANGEELEIFEQPLEIAKRFTRYKLAPLPSGTIDALTGKDAVGQPANLTKFESPKQVIQENVIVRRVLPMLTGNIIDTVSQEGWIGVPMVLPALAGFGVSSYPDRGIRAIKNQAVVDLLESLKITSNSLLGQKTKDEALDKEIQSRIMAKVETLETPQGATEVGKEKIVKERLAQIRNLARAEAAIAEPKLYADYLKSKEGSESVSVLTDEEKKTLTEQDLTNYRSRYAEAYVEMLQRASQAPNWSKLTDDEKEKVLARIPRIAHNRAKIDLVKTKRKGTP